MMGHEREKQVRGRVIKWINERVDLMLIERWRNKAAKQWESVKRRTEFSTEKNDNKPEVCL